MILNVNIENRVAVYIPSDEKPVCGNSDDQIKFTFDEEWATHENKTARFGWNGHYFDVEFTGDTCDVPVITNTTQFTVGVYVGEGAEGEHLLSSTKATIPIKLSVRCSSGGAHAGTGANYTNEAKGAAAQATEAAEQATEAAERAEAAGGLKEVGSLTYALMGSQGFRLQGGGNDYEPFGASVSNHIQPLQYKRVVSTYEGTQTTVDHVLAVGLVDLFKSCRFVKMTVENRASYNFVKDKICEEWISDTLATTDCDTNNFDESMFSWANIVENTSATAKGATKLVHYSYDNKAADWVSDYTQADGYVLWLSEGVQHDLTAYWNATQGGGYAFVTFTGYN